MDIRHAGLSDLPRILEIYASARNFMIEHGNPTQWGDNWPPEELIRDDIHNQHCYVCVENEQLIAVFYYNHARDPFYDVIENGNWVGDDDYAVVHRIATDGTVKGTGSYCLQWAFSQHPHLRIDTHGDNVVMQGMLQKNGFQYCGIVHVPEDDMPRLAFEKVN